MTMTYANDFTFSDVNLRFLLAKIPEVISNRRKLMLYICDKVVPFYTINLKIATYLSSQTSTSRNLVIFLVELSLDEGPRIYLSHFSMANS